jgi:hypothetical protein
VLEWTRAALRDLPLRDEQRAALIGDLRRLRWIKHRLAVARDLPTTCGGGVLDDELRDWLAIRDQLP